MRKLLFLAHRIPYPPNKGDKIRSFHILRHLAGRFRIRLGCFADDPDDLRHVDALREYCAEVFCLPLPKFKKAVRSANGLLRGRSISESCYQDERMMGWVQQTLKNKDIGAIFVFCAAMAPYISDRSGGRPTIIDMVDVDSEKWGAYAESAGWVLHNLFRYEQRHVFELEKRSAAAADRLLFVSKAEVDLFKSLAPEFSDRMVCLENGVDLDYFDPAKSYSNPFDAAKLPIIFTGMMDYRANIDAVSWFASEVFPRVRRTCSSAEFWIVGARPAGTVRQLEKQEGVHVTGAVRDVRPYLAHAACVVAPLRVARGIQNKVLEAMAMAKPVVLTPVALQGLDAVPGVEVLSARDPEELSELVSAVLLERYRGIGHAARARIEQEYRWSQKLAVLDDLLSGQLDAG